LLTLVAQKHQAAAATKHAHGSLPLHLLCKNREGLSLASLEALIAAHPQVLFVSFYLYPVLLISNLELCRRLSRFITETKHP
jgi:hypothetical protein